jgi:hypothetical protein
MVRIRGMCLILLAQDKYNWRDFVKDDEIFDSINILEIY